jgi:hypothetical protein
MWAGSVVWWPRTELRRWAEALAAVEDLDRGRGQARVDVLGHERVRDGVVVAVELDVIVDVDADADLPVAVDEGLGGERTQRGLIQPFEELAAAGAVDDLLPDERLHRVLPDGAIGAAPALGESIAVHPRT